MSNKASVTPAKDSAVIHEISLDVDQAILALQYQQPELLREKYRNILWRNSIKQAVLQL